MNPHLGLGANTTACSAVRHKKHVVAVSLEMSIGVSIAFLGGSFLFFTCSGQEKKNDKRSRIHFKAPAKMQAGSQRPTRSVLGKMRGVALE
jgi:hypothetical protein